MQHGLILVPTKWYVQNSLLGFEKYISQSCIYSTSTTGIGNLVSLALRSI